MKTCKTCDRGYNKGALVYAIVNGKIVQMRVCQKCAKSAVCIVLPSVKSTTCSCGQTAEKCGRCVDKAKQAAAKNASDVKVWTKKLQGLIRAYESTKATGVEAEQNAGRIEGLQMALNIISGGKLPQPE